MQGLAALGRTVLVLAAAVGGVAALDARTPPRRRWREPTDAGEVARLLEQCRDDGRPAHGTWDGAAPWVALAELGPRAAPAVPLALERLRRTEVLYRRGERDVVLACPRAALPLLVELVLDPNVSPRVAGTAAGLLRDLDDDALFALDGVPALPPPVRAAVERWVRDRGVGRGAPSDAARLAALVAPEPVPPPASDLEPGLDPTVGVGPRGAPVEDPFARHGPGGRVVPPSPALAPARRREVRFAAACSDGGGAAGGFVVRVDLTVVPDYAPEVFDELAAGMWRPDRHLRAAGGDLVVDVPEDLALHGFGVRDGAPWYAYVPAFAATPPLGVVPGRRPLGGRPVVDGRPVPDGTVVAPGRLDLETTRAVAVRAAREYGYAVLLHPRADPATLLLPPTDAVTVWHPSFGAAWLPWRDGEAPTGPACPGALVLHGGPPGATVALTASLPRPHVSGSHFVPPWRIVLDADGAARVAGLPFGAYEVGLPGRRRHDVAPSAGAPEVVVDLAAAHDGR